MIETTNLRCVTGNTSWWKAKKYRRETAMSLFEYRARGWRLVAIRRLPITGTDTRIFSEYTLVREHAGADACQTAGGTEPTE